MHYTKRNTYGKNKSRPSGKILPLAKEKKQDFVLQKVSHSILKSAGLKVILQRV